MNDAVILSLLKTDLEISAAARDPFLLSLIDVAKQKIEGEGIKLEDTRADSAMVEMYAAHLYRIRKDPGRDFPRALRMILNDRIIGQKARGV